ncbi:hypothetical protein [Serratia sp. JSRIV004]|uniref:hypothetical protein n=1 Tax=Serratia sp. JSRIV004 TaxID=2831895 RepID=UPI001CBF3980|nr:hypothetical protein [Serratia sp. JSRIV004]UAN59600.1 hypothetical protein KGP21_11350 [Serratia sp. JSRIV004]
MTDKLEALSQPVGWTTQEELNEANGGVGWMFLSPMKQPDEIALYSQEYVTALLNENAELKASLSEWEDCKHDGATYHDMSGRERCGRCGADL